MIDTHCHLNFDAYDSDREQVIQRALEAGVTHIIIPAVDIESFEAVIELADQHQGIKAAVGVHPNSTADFSDTHLATIKAKAQESNQVVAIGEIGLDYYWDKSPKQQQIKAFENQLALAAELALPVIVHNRDASEDILNILEAWTQ